MQSNTVNAEQFAHGAVTGRVSGQLEISTGFREILEQTEWSRQDETDV